MIGADLKGFPPAPVPVVDPSIASADLCDIWANGGDTVHVTGTVTITSFGIAPKAGLLKKVIFDGALTLTHSANLYLPGAANITTAADDFCFVYADTTTQFDCLYFPRSGNFLPALTTRGDIIYRNATVPARLAVGAVDALLSSDGTDPVWRPGLTTRGDLLYRNATVPIRLAVGANNAVLGSDGTDPIWRTTLAGLTLTSPTINGGAATALTGLAIRSTGTGAFDLTFANTENLTVGRTLTVTVNNAARTVDLGGNLTTAAAFITSGANSLTLTTTGATDVTLPTTGTLATRAGIETLTNKSLTSPTITGTPVIAIGATAVTTFLSTGIDDNADTLVMTLTAAELVGINNTAPRANLDVLPSGGSANTTFAGYADAVEAVIAGPNKVPSSNSVGAQLTISSNDAQAADLGGNLGFGGRTNNADAGAPSWALFKAGKLNNTSGNTHGYLSLWLRRTGDGAITEFSRWTAAADFLVGKTAQATSTAGFETNISGATAITRSSGTALTINRLTDDGTLIDLQQADVSEGSISVSGVTVAYNTFTGGHWSQLQGGGRPSIPLGTVVSAVDDLCGWLAERWTDIEDVPHYVLYTGIRRAGETWIEVETKSLGFKVMKETKARQVNTIEWRAGVPVHVVKTERYEAEVTRPVQVMREDGTPHLIPESPAPDAPLVPMVLRVEIRETTETFKTKEVVHRIVAEDNEHLAKFKVSDVVIDPRVYGVFMGWDNDGDAQIHALGTTSIRVRGPVRGGDLLESAGDGTARKQLDTLLRSSTIGKVTSAAVIETYPDGSWRVPCVLYCG